MSAIAASFWDFQLLGHKVTFDGENKLIIPAPGVTNLNIGVDVYSDWKEWQLMDNRNNTKWDAAMRTIGGDPTVAPDAAGVTYFTINGWQILLPQALDTDGNTFSDDFASPFVTAEGVFLATQKFTNLVDKVAPDINVVSSAVWQTTNPINNETYASTLTEIANNSSTLVQGVSLTDSQAIMLREMYYLMGLDPTKPLIATPSSRTAGASVIQTITGDPDTAITVTRTP